MDRRNILNILARRYNYKTFLEIGVRKGYCLLDVNIPHKDGVDPVGPPANFIMTSDEFFDSDGRGMSYDLIHIDGCHTYEQSYKDVINSLPHIAHNINGAIVMHDTLPPTLESAKKDGDRHGEVWKTIVKLRCTMPNLKIYIIDTDYGCAFIQMGKQKLYIKDSLETCLDWDYMQKHKKELLNIITTNEFKDLLVGDGWTNQDFQDIR